MSTNPLEAPSIIINAVSLPTSDSGSAGTAATVTLQLDADGGTCASSSLSGPESAWVSLPAAADCTKAGMALVGWQPARSTQVLAPGSSTQLTGANTLRAVWAAKVAGGAAPDTTPPTSGTARLIVWSAKGTNVLSGDPTTITGTPVFTIVTTKPDLVTPRMVRTAQALAAQHGGIYDGVREGNAWRTPRIVAAYLA